MVGSLIETVATTKEIITMVDMVPITMVIMVIATIVITIQDMVYGGGKCFDVLGSFTDFVAIC